MEASRANFFALVVTSRARGSQAVVTVVVFGVCPRKVACNSIGRSFNKVRKCCNSNDLISGFERVVGELYAELGVGSAMMWILISTPGPTGVEGAGGTGGHGRASRRGAERSEVA